MPAKKPEFIGGDGPSFPKIHFRFRLPGRTGRFLILGAAFGLLLLLFLSACFTYIRPNEFGIKEVQIGVNRGIQEKVYGPGLAFQMPFGIETIHRFPRAVQALELTDYPEPQRFPSHTYDAAAIIQTSDGFYVDVDVTILYRIVDPYKLITTIGPGNMYLEQGIKPKAVPILKQALGELTTEEFYNSPLRVTKAHQARDLLRAEMAPKGMEVEHVLVRYFKYSDEIQRNIEEKKLQDQLVFKNQSEKRAATEAAKLKQTIQEGEMNVKIALQEGEAYKVRRAAERDLYTRTKRAEADLLVQLSEAKKTEMRNEAMQAAGVDKAVALKMAEVLKGLDVIVVPVGGPGGFNPLDLSQVTGLFGVAPESPPAGGAISPRPASSAAAGGQGIVEFLTGNQQESTP